MYNERIEDALKSLRCDTIATMMNSVAWPWCDNGRPGLVRVTAKKVRDRAKELLHQAVEYGDEVASCWNSGLVAQCKGGLLSISFSLGVGEIEPLVPGNNKVIVAIDGIH